MKREQPYQIAMFRGAIEALVVFGLALLSNVLIGADWGTAAIIGGIAGLTTFGGRAGYEGIVDQRAAR